MEEGERKEDNLQIEDYVYSVCIMCICILK